MKKSLKEELVSLAHRILQLKEGTSYEQMTEDARAVYEKLTILAYAEKMEKAHLPTIGLGKVEEAIADLEGQGIIEEMPVASPSLTDIATPHNEKSTEDRTDYQHRPDGTLFNEDEPVHEAVIEKIKDMVAEMPPEAAAIDQLLETIEPKNFQKNDMFDIAGEYAQTPIFEPVVAEEEKPKNLNDRLKAGLKVGLNDKLAFVKHLFDGNTEDYVRVVSQLETFTTLGEAQDFVSQMIKPDHGNWEGKEEYEERFMQIVSNKFE